MEHTAAKLIRNRARCKQCNDIIESALPDAYVECSCGAIYLDGGAERPTAGGSAVDFDDMSEYE